MLLPRKKYRTDSSKTQASQTQAGKGERAYLKSEIKKAKKPRIIKQIFDTGLNRTYDLQSKMPPNIFKTSAKLALNP